MDGLVSSNSQIENDGTSRRRLFLNTQKRISIHVFFRKDQRARPYVWVEEFVGPIDAPQDAIMIFIPRNRLGISLSQREIIHTICQKPHAVASHDSNHHLTATSTALERLIS